MDITSVVCGVNNTRCWVTCVGDNPITVAHELTSWSIWHLAKYLSSWLLSTLASNFGASSTMACEEGAPGSEWHFSWHQWWCLLWPFPLSLQLQSLWTQVPRWGISLCWPLRYEDAGHNFPSKYIHTSHHNTSHHITTQHSTTHHNTAQHITTQHSTSISKHWLHAWEHTHSPSTMGAHSNMSTIIAQLQFKPASEAVSLWHGQWRRTASPHRAQSWLGIGHYLLATVQSVVCVQWKCYVIETTVASSAHFSLMNMLPISIYCNNIWDCTDLFQFLIQIPPNPNFGGKLGMWNGMQWPPSKPYNCSWHAHLKQWLQYGNSCVAELKSIKESCEDFSGAERLR